VGNWIGLLDWSALTVDSVGNRRPGRRKTDATDAHSVAVVPLRTRPLRQAGRDDRTIALRLLADRRDEFGAQLLRTHRGGSVANLRGRPGLRSALEPSTGGSRRYWCDGDVRPGTPWLRPSASGSAARAGGNALASDRWYERKPVLDALRSANLQQRLRGYDRDQVDRVIQELIQKLS